MLEYTVNQNGTADFITVTEAVQAVPYAQSAVIRLANGVYREKLYCDKKDITLMGESQSGTRIVFGDGAKHLHADGTPYGTFRSWTALFTGEKVHIENLTIENDAGDGKQHGQAVAAYMDAAFVHCKNVLFIAHQDTLFTAPLPQKERQQRGFLGPREHTPRTPSAQLYESCCIMGDIDFIYGGADVLFKNCELVMRDRGEEINGYFAAPSTPKEGVGYVFYRCNIHGDQTAQPATAYLARPWREYGKAAFIECQMSAVVHPDGFHDWDNADNRTTCTFAEYGTTGSGAAAKRAFGYAFSCEEAQKLVGICEKRINAFLY